MRKTINLLEGNIFTSLTGLAIPIMLTSRVQMAYNMTDMIWIGRLSSDAVAAVGSAGMYMWLANGLVTMAKLGSQIKIAHTLGANDKNEATEYTKSALHLGIGFGVIYGLISVIFATQLIGFFNLNSLQVIADAKIYLMVTCGLVVFSFMNQIFTGILTAMGNSKTSFTATAIGLIINIILDPILIFGFGFIPAMGVLGAAIATVIAQAVVMTVFIYSVKEDTVIFSNVKLFSKPSMKHIRSITLIGLPAAIQSMIFTGISMIIARFIAGWGDSAIAVQKVGSQIESISWMTAEGFAAAVNSFVAQNFGANNIKRAKKGVTTAMGVVIVWGCFSTMLLIVFPEFIFKIFIPEAELLGMGVDYLRILGVSQLLMCIEITTAGAFQGFGKTMPPSIVGIILTSARIPMVIVLSATALKLNGIWWSISISSILKGVVLLTWFIIFIKKYEKTHQESKI